MAYTAPNPLPQHTEPELLENAESCTPAARTQREFAGLINGAWRRSAEGFIQTGQYLIEAKEELDRDQFEALVRLRLDFDASVARKLMRVAGDRGLRAHVHMLPPCWSSLYELSKLEDDALEAAIADGRVNPKMQRRDAVALRKPSNESKPPNGSEESPPSPPLPKPVPSFADAWDIATKAAIGAKLAAEGCAGVCAVLPPELKAELGDHLLGQAIRSASTTSSFAIKATDRLHTALRCAEQETPSEQDIQTLIATLRSIARDAERRGLARSDLVIAEGKSKRRNK